MRKHICRIMSLYYRELVAAMSSILRTCILIILIVSVRGNWEKIGERILNKISQ